MAKISVSDSAENSEGADEPPGANENKDKANGTFGVCEIETNKTFKAHNISAVNFLEQIKENTIGGPRNLITTIGNATL